MLEVRSVQKRFKTTEALRGVSFDVQEGETFGLLGPNGAGKTTLLSIIAGLMEADGGQVRLQGQPFDGRRDLRPLIGIVPQELALYSELTAAENLRFFGSLYGVRDPELGHRVGRILTTLGLEDRASARVATFSGGMQRRLNLAPRSSTNPSCCCWTSPRPASIRSRAIACSRRSGGCTRRA